MSERVGAGLKIISNLFQQEDIDFLLEVISRPDDYLSKVIEREDGLHFGHTRALGKFKDWIDQKIAPLFGDDYEVLEFKLGGGSTPVAPHVDVIHQESGFLAPYDEAKTLLAPICVGDVSEIGEQLEYVSAYKNLFFNQFYLGKGQRFCAGKDVARNELQVVDYRQEEFIGLNEGDPLCIKEFQRQLSHFMFEDLKGFSLASAYSWTLGEGVLFFSRQIHCSNNFLNFDIPHRHFFFARANKKSKSI
jgi:hypothetical protein